MLVNGDQNIQPSFSTYLEGIAVMDKHRVSFELGGRPRFLTGDKPCPFGREPLSKLASVWRIKVNRRLKKKLTDILLRHDSTRGEVLKFGGEKVGGKG